MRVNTDELNSQAAELRRIAERISDIDDTVRYVTRALCRERFGERFQSPLNNMAGSITRQTEDLIRMSSVLQQISAIYEKTEGRIVDEAEHANVHHEHISPALFSIPSMVFWTTRPTHPRYNPITLEAGDDMLVVNGLPAADDLGWEDVIAGLSDTPDTGHHDPAREMADEALDALRDTSGNRHGRGYIPPVEIPVFEPIEIPLVPTSHADPDTTGLIDWTDWDE